jgi:ribonucleoside-diphosphate reductase beta chain
MPLNQQLLPLKDYHKAKKLLWNPQDLDYSQDKADWAGLDEREKDLVRQVLTLFLAGETYVTHDLAPLLVALRHEGGHLEEEMFLTTQLFEESKHVEFFDDVITHVVGEELDYDAVAGESYRQLFGVELASALGRLLTDHSRHAQVEAVVTYHMMIEGVVAETGYYGLFTALRSKGLMPAFTRGLEYVQRDEARHVAFGLHLLTRLVTEEPALWPVMESRLERLLPLSQGITLQVLEDYLPNIPLGLDLNDVLTYSASQYMARMNVLNRAKPKLVAA